MTNPTHGVASSIAGDRGSVVLLSPRSLTAQDTRDLFDLSTRGEWSILADRLDQGIAEANFPFAAQDAQGCTLFMHAVTAKELYIVKTWPPNHPSLHVVDATGKTAAHCAALFANKATWGLLMDLGVSPLVADQFGFTPLHYAAKGNDDGLFHAIVATLIQVQKPDRVDQLSTRPLEVTPLHLVCAQEKSPSGWVTLLLTHGALMRRVNGEKKNALHVALHRGNALAASELLHHLLAKHRARQVERQNEANERSIQVEDPDTALVDIADPIGCLPLHLAIEKGMVAAVEALFALGSDPNADWNKASPLHIAIKYYLVAEGEKKSHYLMIINLCLTNGADPDRGDQGETPLYRACVDRDLFLATLLRQHRANIHKGTSNATPLQAVRRMKLESPTQPWQPLIEFLESEGATDQAQPLPPSSIQQGTLAFGKQNLNLPKKQHLQSAQDKEGNLWFHLICADERYECVLDACLQPLSAEDLKRMNGRGHTFLHSACASGNLRATEKLLAKGITVLNDYTGNSFLHAAASSQSLALLRLLFTNRQLAAAVKKLINLPNSQGNPPLVAAIATANPDVVALFLSLGRADPNVANLDPAHRDTSPLHWAVANLQKQHKALFTALLKGGAAPNRPNDQGDLPLGLAYKLDRIAAFTALLECGISPHGVRVGSNTLLQQASFDGKTAYVKVLIGHREISNVELQIALLLACQQGHTEVVTLLLNSQGKLKLNRKSKQGTVLTLTVRQHCRSPKDGRFIAIAAQLLARIKPKKIDTPIKVAKDLTRKTSKGKTKTNRISTEVSALRIACELDATVEMIMLLLSRGASPNQGAFPQRSLLSLVCMKRDPIAAVTEFLRQGAKFFAEESWPEQPAPLVTLLAERLRPPSEKTPLSRKVGGLLQNSKSLMQKFKKKPPAAAAAAATSISQREEEDVVTDWSLPTDEMSVSDVSSQSDRGAQGRIGDDA